jgi:hypothetical protein
MTANVLAGGYPPDSIFVKRQNVPLQNRCALDFEPFFSVCFPSRDFTDFPRVEFSEEEDLLGEKRESLTPY